MFRKFFLIGLFLLSAGAAHTLAQGAINPVKWSLKVERSVELLNEGNNFMAVLSAEIERGWHLYALEKIEGGPIPTLISVPDGLPFELGKIDAPAPLENHDSAFGVTTKFYQNTVDFNLPIRVSDKAQKSSTSLKIKVRYQICSEEVCLAPKTVIVSP